MYKIWNIIKTKIVLIYLNSQDYSIFIKEYKLTLLLKLLSIYNRNDL
jgi:hypothetical protein